VSEGKFHVALRTLRVVKRLRLRSLCTVGFGLYVEKRLPLLVEKLFAATLQVIAISSVFIWRFQHLTVDASPPVSSFVVNISPGKVLDHRHRLACSGTRSQTSRIQYQCNCSATAFKYGPYTSGRHACYRNRRLDFRAPDAGALCVGALALYFR
jgi:hypothetical protein